VGRAVSDGRPYPIPPSSETVSVYHIHLNLGTFTHRDLSAEEEYHEGHEEHEGGKGYIA
jgi:hypothetical protein